MARPKADKKEGPLTKGEFSALITHVDCIKQEMLSHCVEEFTYDDYFELFIPSELQQSFRDVHKHAIMPAYYNNSFNILWLDYTIEVDVNGYGGYKPPLIPYGVILKPSASPELIHRVTSVVTERARILTDFDRVKAVIAALNKWCETASQMRVFWPQIATLALRAELTTLIDKMKFNPRYICTLPVAVRKACQKAAITLTQAQLLSDTQKPEIETALTFRLNHFFRIEDGFTFDVRE